MSRPCPSCLAVLLFAAPACGEEPPALVPRDIEPIAEPTSWELVPPAQDVWVGRRPSPVSCDPQLGYFVEDYNGIPSFKVDTGWCNFITVRQPARVDLRADEVIDLKVWHFELQAMASAEAWLGLAIDGEVVWEEQVPIPASPGLVEALIELPGPVREGAELQFHVDNHGDNQYMLFRLEREPGE